jgi:transposase
MPAKRYLISLSDEERQTLEELTTKGKASARKINHARILLKANLNQEDRGWSDQAISLALNISTRTIERVRQRFVEEGLENALIPPPKTSLKLRKIDGEREAHLVAIACSPAPTGYNRWTLRLLADQMVVMGYVENISHESVRQVLKKMRLSLGYKNLG